MRHRETETINPQYRDSKTKTPRHRETETVNLRYCDSKTFFKRTKSHGIEIPGLKKPRHQDSKTKKRWHRVSTEFWSLCTLIEKFGVPANVHLCLWAKIAQVIYLLNVGPNRSRQNCRWFFCPFFWLLLVNCGPTLQR